LVFDSDSEAREKNIEFEASKKSRTVVMEHRLFVER